MSFRPDVIGTGINCYSAPLKGRVSIKQIAATEDHHKQFRSYALTHRNGNITERWSFTTVKTLSTLAWKAIEQKRTAVNSGTIVMTYDHELRVMI